MVPSSCSERQTGLRSQRTGTVQGPGQRGARPCGQGQQLLLRPRQDPSSENIPQPPQTPGQTKTLPMGVSRRPLPASQANRGHAMGLSTPPYTPHTDSVSVLSSRQPTVTWDPRVGSGPSTPSAQSLPLSSLTLGSVCTPLPTKWGPLGGSGPACPLG